MSSSGPLLYNCTRIPFERWMCATTWRNARGEDDQVVLSFLEKCICTHTRAAWRATFKCTQHPSTKANKCKCNVMLLPPPPSSAMLFLSNLNSIFRLNGETLNLSFYCIFSHKVPTVGDALLSHQLEFYVVGLEGIKEMALLCIIII